MTKAIPHPKRLSRRGAYNGPEKSLSSELHDAGVDVDAVQVVPVIAAVGLGEIAVGVVEIPLTSRRAGIVARCRLRVHSELRHQPATDVLVVEVASDAKLRQLNLAGSKDLSRSRDRVVLWAV